MSVRRIKPAPAQPGIHDNIVDACMRHLVEIRRLVDDILDQDSPRHAQDDAIELLHHVRSVEIELDGARAPGEEAQS